VEDQRNMHSIRQRKSLGVCSGALTSVVRPYNDSVDGMGEDRTTLA
jgi:hypothetical protein